MRLLTTPFPALIILAALTGGCTARAQSDPGVDAFWTAADADERRAHAATLQDWSVDRLYSALFRGPRFPAESPTGTVTEERVGADGLRYPYVLLIPEDYDPTRAWPVEIYLHGGVGRPAWEPGEPLWRRGYDQLRHPERIVIVPGAWNEAFWWFPNQAENVPAILRHVKSRYHVDDDRVYLSGVSDGGTGTYFFAFMQPTEWAAFLPFIGHPGVLRNPAGRASYALSFENLVGKPLYIVNGENDPLYPAASMAPYVELLERVQVEHVFRVIPGGGHNTAWLPEETPAIEAFKASHPRDPLPDALQWVTDRTDRFNRNHWIRIDRLAEAGRPGRLIVRRTANRFEVTAYSITDFTLLLSPAEVDFSRPVQVVVNGTSVLDGPVAQSTETLLHWAATDLDRSLLFTAELNLQVPADAR